MRQGEPSSPDLLEHRWKNIDEDERNSSERNNDNKATSCSSQTSLPNSSSSYRSALVLSEQDKYDQKSHPNQRSLQNSLQHRTLVTDVPSRRDQQPASLPHFEDRQMSRPTPGGIASRKLYNTPPPLNISRSLSNKTDPASSPRRSFAVEPFTAPVRPESREAPRALESHNQPSSLPSQGKPPTAYFDEPAPARRALAPRSDTLKYRQSVQQPVSLNSSQGQQLISNFLIQNRFKEQDKRLTDACADKINITDAKKTLATAGPKGGHQYNASSKPPDRSRPFPLRGDMARPVQEGDPVRPIQSSDSARPVQEGTKRMARPVQRTLSSRRVGAAPVIVRREVVNLSFAPAPRRLSAGSAQSSMQAAYPGRRRF